MAGKKKTAKPQPEEVPDVEATLKGKQRVLSTRVDPTIAERFERASRALGYDPSQALRNILLKQLPAIEREAAEIQKALGAE